MSLATLASVPSVVDSGRAAYSSIHITMKKAALGGGGHEKDTGTYLFSLFILIVDYLLTPS